MTSSTTLLHDLSSELSSVKSARIAAQEECRRESARLKEIALLCDFFNNNGLNSREDCWNRSSELSDLSTIESTTRDDSDDNADDKRDDSSCETLDDLLLEEKLVSAELTYLSTDADDADDDDDDLKEFQKIEREIKVAELEKCLQSVKKQIHDKSEEKRKRKRLSSAPLADAESFDDKEDDADDRRRRERWQRRPLTLYLPIADKELDLTQRIRDLGHDLSQRPEVAVSGNSCSGSLYKLCQNSDNKWRKRFFVFDRENQLLAYFTSKTDFKRNRKPRGVAFDEIRDVFVNHSRIKSSRFVFTVVCDSRAFVLSSFRPEVMRIWIDVIITGANHSSNQFQE
ncbi:unnamed protein product [Medioppia subpectinata]|uniref:PH domain-containing protein n=1 Tax=Medioppia subpectinata TaxID=1979941 RepID=A0A7R9PV09_9ACAR|nr:unnamed protein product [Medioppia subpectinata]CAG2101800.1 unnamed protein product [Medioppia subpectinata]